MAKRKQPFHPDEVRQKIRATQLCNRLHSHAFGEITLDATQVRAIEILLKKTVPDLASIQLSGDKANPIAHQMIEQHIIDPKG